jgi:hypothetical protein
VSKFAYVDLSFGGERDNHSFDPLTGRLKNVKTGIESTSYMLAYIRKDSMLQLMEESFMNSKPPQWLKDKHNLSKQEEVGKELSSNSQISL